MARVGPRPRSDDLPGPAVLGTESYVNASALMRERAGAGICAQGYPYVGVDMLSCAPLRTALATRVTPAEGMRPMAPTRVNTDMAPHRRLTLPWGFRAAWRDPCGCQ